jgi:hypothetical protein
LLLLCHVWFLGTLSSQPFGMCVDSKSVIQDKLFSRIGIQNQLFSLVSTNVTCVFCHSASSQLLISRRTEFKSISPRMLILQHHFTAVDLITYLAPRLRVSKSYTSSSPCASVVCSGAALPLFRPSNIVDPICIPKLRTYIIVKFRVFWDVVPCRHIEVDRRFRGGYCLHHQGNDSPWWWRPSAH